MKTKVKTLETKNDNLLVSSTEQPSLVAYFRPNFDFIRYANGEEEWDWAERIWGKVPQVKKLKEDPFPWVRQMGNMEYTFYKKGHSKAGIISRTAKYQDEEEGEVCFENLTSGEAIFLKSESLAFSSLNGNLSLFLGFPRKKERVEKNKIEASLWMQKYPIKLFRIIPENFKDVGGDVRWSCLKIKNLHDYVVLGEHDLFEDDYHYLLYEGEDGHKELIYTNGVTGNPDYSFGVEELDGFIKGKSFKNKTIEILDAGGVVLSQQHQPGEDDDDYFRHPNFYKITGCRSWGY